MLSGPGAISFDLGLYGAGRLGCRRCDRTLPVRLIRASEFERRINDVQSGSI